VLIFGDCSGGVVIVVEVVLVCVAIVVLTEDAAAATAKVVIGSLIFGGDAYGVYCMGPVLAPERGLSPPISEIRSFVKGLSGVVRLSSSVTKDVVRIDGRVFASGTGAVRCANCCAGGCFVDGGTSGLCLGGEGLAVFVDVIAAAAAAAAGGGVGDVGSVDGVGSVDVSVGSVGDVGVSVGMVCLLVSSYSYLYSVGWAVTDFSGWMGFSRSSAVLRTKTLVLRVGGT
tara:strand:+ start:53 stop:736 length:684 start_codon:yes stop_codon:yes gene_type:complete